MYRLTLNDAQNDLGLRKASNVAPTSADFIDYVNRAQRMLLRRGDWYDTEFVVSFCVSGCVIQWPRWVGAIRGIRFGKGKPGQLFNNNFAFVGPHHRHGGFHGDALVTDLNAGPTANEVSGTTGKQIRYYVVNSADFGKTITLFGTKYGGQPLSELVNGTPTNGVTLTAAGPFAVTTDLVTRIDAITRQATTGMAYLYEYDPTAGTLRDLAYFEPGDTNPRIRRSKIVNRPYDASAPDANGIHWTSIEALVKVDFIPALLPRDFLMLDNLDALTYMVRAIKENEAGDKASSEASIIEAIRELNFELRDRNSDDQIPIRISPVIGRNIKNPY